MIFIRIHKCGDHLLLSMIVLLTDPLLLELTVEDLCTKLKVAEEKLRKMEGVEERLQIVEKKLERLTAMMESNQRCQYSPEDSSSLYDIHYDSSPQDQNQWYEECISTPPPVTSNIPMTPYNLSYQTPPSQGYHPLETSTRYNSSRQIQIPTLNNNTTPFHSQSLQQPSCLTIRRKISNVVPSTAINKTILLPSSVVLSRYPNLKGETKVGTLAMRLARESFFGEDVMAKCTVMGCRDFPGLPLNELNSLKQLMFSLFPNYWTNPAEFEGIWMRCVDAIGQYCKRKRAELEKLSLI